MKQYYECHITIARPEFISTAMILLVQNLIKSKKWKYSAIDGDPFLGDGIKLYATRHFNIKLPEEEVLQKLNSVADFLEESGFKVVRRKIEKVIYDTKLVNAKCNGGCKECHLDDLS